MDKVIIDGVDVSECDFRLVRDGNQKCECCHATGFGVICDCEMWKTCYYKQLKRLQAENERLKEELRTEKIYSSQIEELEESLQHAKGREKYRQALQEIRDIAGSIIGNANATYTDFYNKLSDILDKINSVIGAE